MSIKKTIEMHRKAIDQALEDELKVNIKIEENSNSNFNKFWNTVLSYWNRIKECIQLSIWF